MNETAAKAVPRGWFDLAVVTAIVAAALAAHWPCLHQPVNRDISAYATIGARMHCGQWPYRDLFDHKQPLIYALFWLLSAIAPRSNAAIQLSATALAAGAGIVIYFAISRLMSRFSAAAAALLFVVIGAARAFEGTDLNTEHLLAAVACPAVLFPLCARKSNFTVFVAGLFAAAAIGAKIVGVFIVPAILFPLLVCESGFTKRPVSIAAIFACGVAAPWLVLIAIYWIGGGLGDFVWANVVYNLKYVAALQQQKLRWATLIYVLVGSAAVVGTICLLQSRGRDRVSWTVSLWLLGALVGAKAGRGDFPHYFAPVVAPAVILATAPLIGASQLLRFTRAIAVTAIALPFCVDTFSNYGARPSEIGMKMFGEQSIPWNYQQRAGEWLRTHAAARDRLFVAGAEPGFYWQSGLQPSQKYLYDYPSQLLPDFNQELAQNLESRPPEWLILPQNRDYPYLRWASANRYEPAMQWGPVRLLRLRRSTTP